MSAKGTKPEIKAKRALWSLGLDKTSRVITILSSFVVHDDLLNSEGINPTLPTFFQPIQHITGKQFREDLDTFSGHQNWDRNV